MTIAQARRSLGNHPPAILKFNQPPHPKHRRAARILVRAVKRGLTLGAYDC